MGSLGLLGGLHQGLGEFHSGRDIPRAAPLGHLVSVGSLVGNLLEVELLVGRLEALVGLGAFHWPLADH